MIFYIIFLSIILYISIIAQIIKSRTIHKISYFLILIIIILLAALRFDVGFDYGTYYKIITQMDIKAIERFEPLNQFIFYLAVYLNSPFICFLIYAILTYSFIFYALRKLSVNFYFSILIYISLFLLDSLTFTRQAAALGISFWAFQYVKDKKIFSFICWITIAILFHTSAIITLLIYPLYHFFKIKYVCIIAIFMLVLKSIIFYFLTNADLYTSYLERINDIPGGSFIRYFYILLIASLLIININHSSKQSQQLFVITIFALPFPFLFGSHLGMRLANYFFIYTCLLTPLILKDRHSTFQFIYRLFFILYLYLFLYITSISNKSQYIPYNFYWDKEYLNFR